METDKYIYLYEKYKTKYISLKKQLGGNKIQDMINIGFYKPTAELIIPKNIERAIELFNLLKDINDNIKKSSIVYHSLLSKISDEKFELLNKYIFPHDIDLNYLLEKVSFMNESNLQKLRDVYLLYLPLKSNFIFKYTDSENEINNIESTIFTKYIIDIIINNNKISINDIAIKLNIKIVEEKKLAKKKEEIRQLKSKYKIQKRLNSLRTDNNNII